MPDDLELPRVDSGGPMFWSLSRSLSGIQFGYRNMCPFPAAQLRIADEPD